MVSGEGMNPAMLCCRKKMKVTATISATRPPAVTSQGRARRDREHREGERNGEDGTEHRGVPGPAPQDAVESEGRARDGHRDGGRHHPGLGTGSAGRDAAPGERAVGSSSPAVPVPVPWLRCGARVMAGPPRRGGRRPRRTSPGLPGRRLPRRQAASSGRIPPGPAIRPAAAPPAPRALRRSPRARSVTSSAKAFAPNAAAGDSARASAGVRLPRTARTGPRSRWAESLSIRVSSKACGAPPGPEAAPERNPPAAEDPVLVPAAALRGLGGAPCGTARVVVVVGVVRAGEWMAARLSAMDCSPAVPVYSSASGRERTANSGRRARPRCPGTAGSSCVPQGPPIDMPL